jgi:hypothetical protein
LKENSGQYPTEDKDGVVFYLKSEDTGKHEDTNGHQEQGIKEVPEISKEGIFVYYLDVLCS